LIINGELIKLRILTGTWFTGQDFFWLLWWKTCPPYMFVFKIMLPLFIIKKLMLNLIRRVLVKTDEATQPQSS